VTIVAADRVRARELALAFGVRATAHAPHTLWRVPGAVVIDSPARLLHPAAHRLLRHLVAPNVVVVGGGDDPGVGLALLHAGVGALLPHDVPATAVPQALAAVLAGEAIVPPTITAELVAWLRESDRLG
jgi:DNA-binding NarL/FixJ family response regulator